MLRWLAGLLTIVVLISSYLSYQQHTDLLEARGQLKHVREQAVEAVQAAELEREIATAAQREAQRHAARATAAERKLVIANAKADAAVAEAPDTCAPFIAAVEGARDLAVETAESWRQSYVSEQQATARLTLSNENLMAVVRDYGDASEAILDATKPSFVQRLIPKIGVGCTAGYDPTSNRLGTACGPTMTWSF